MSGRDEGGQQQMAQDRVRRARRVVSVAVMVFIAAAALGLLVPAPGHGRADATPVTSLDTVTVVAPTAPSATAGVDVVLGSFAVDGSDDLSLTLRVEPVGSGTLTIGCGSACLGVVYDSGDGVADASFTLRGTAAQVTAALESVTLLAPAEGDVRVVAEVEDRAGVSAGPDGHQYRYYPDPVTAAAAQSAAAGFSLYGSPGYLVTVSSDAEEAYLEDLVDGASVHLGISGSATQGKGSWTWAYTDGPDVASTPTYFDWLPSEPRNPKDEGDSLGFVRLRSKEGKTGWDVSLDNAACCGFVVEFGDVAPVVPVAVVAVSVGPERPVVTPPTTTTSAATTTTPPTTTTSTSTTSTTSTSTTSTSTTSTTSTTVVAPPSPSVPEQWKAKITVNALIGDPAAGAEIVARGDGLKPGRQVEVGVHSTYRVLSTATVGPDGSFELRGTLPADLEVGSHAIEVHYAGDPAVLDSATFQVDSAGALRDGEDRLGFGAYDPGAHTGVVVGATVAVLTLAGAAGAAGGGGGGGGGGQDAGAVGEIDVEEAFDGEFDGRGFGDRRLAVTPPGTALIDRLASVAPTRVGGAVPGVARAIVGSSYLRAMFGSLAALVPAAGLALGVLAASDAGFEALPPSTILLGVILVLSALDGVAGLMAAAGFGGSLVVAGAVDSLNSLLVVAGLLVVMTGVSLMAEMVRPLSRPPGNGFIGTWTRAGDAVVGALFVGWVIKALIESLEGLRGHSLAIASDSAVLAMVCMAGIVGRVGLETLAAHHYPARLREARPTDEVPDYTVTRRWVLVFARTGALMLAAQPFVGWNWFLFAGCLSYGLEQYLDIIQERLPVIRWLVPWVPLRVFKFITSLIICTVVARLLEHWVSGVDLVRVAFVVLNIPMTATETVIALGREGDRGPITWWRRAAGAAMVATGLLIVTGHLL